MPKKSNAKQVRIELPNHVHARLKGQAAYAQKTLAQWIVRLLTLTTGK
jgi:hypothetical protein